MASVTLETVRHRWDPYCYFTSDDPAPKSHFRVPCFIPLPTQTNLNPW